MKWIGRRQSDNVLDQRESTRSMGTARLGMGSILIVGLTLYALGADPKTIFTVLENQLQQSTPYTQVDNRTSEFDSPESAGLVSAVLASLEDNWHKAFARKGLTYQPAKLILFRGAVETSCGLGRSATGPFYCPLDSKVYLDLSFLEELGRLGGHGDFALAYVIAHEIGHHIQTLLSPHLMRSPKGQEDSIAVELQADCYAGVWAHAAMGEDDFLEEGDLEEGLKAAAAVGDDHIQRSAGQRVSPESFTHGTSEQRENSFKTGLRSGSIDACSIG